MRVIDRWGRVGLAGALAVAVTLGAVVVDAPSAQAQPVDAGVASEPGADALSPIALLVRVGLSAEALRAIDGLDAQTRDTPRARYLRGRLLERLRHDVDAAAAFEIASGLPAPVLADARRRRALALARADRCADAAAVLGSSATARVRLAVGECALRANDVPNAVAGLRLAAHGGDGVDAWHARFLLADALARSGARDEAARELHALLVERPDHVDADAALAKLGVLAGPVRFTDAERMARAERLMAVRRAAAAVRELEQVRRPRDRAGRAKLAHARGSALYGTRRRYDEAARVLAESARLGGPNVAEDTFRAARALSRSDQEARAIAAFRRFIRQFPNDERAPEAEYLAAWLEMRLGHRRDGREHMQRFLDGPRASRPGADDFVREGLWHLAFDAYTHGAPRDAIPLFERYTARGDGTMARGRGTYWTARAYQAIGDRAHAIEKLRAAVALEPLHWYALLARQRLVELGEDPGDPFGPAPATPRAAPAPLPPATLPPLAAFHASLGLDSDAVAALREAEGVVKAAAPPGRGVEALAGVYGLLGAPDRASRLAIDGNAAELRRRPDGANRWIWDAEYPRPWSDVVDSETRTRRLPAGYLYAIMRQESSFDPRAVSIADALGLLQLLPSTARGVAQRLGMPFERADLFQPRVNVRLGAAYSEALLGEFPGQPQLAIASYNAGSGRVRGWLARSGRVELDRFVENIPVDQTRNYVRRVTTSWARYRYLESPAAGWPLDLPTHVDPHALSGPPQDPGAGLDD